MTVKDGKDRPTKRTVANDVAAELRFVTVKIQKVRPSGPKVTEANESHVRKDEPL